MKVHLISWPVPVLVLGLICAIAASAQTSSNVSATETSGSAHLSADSINRIAQALLDGDTNALQGALTAGVSPNMVATNKLAALPPVLRLLRGRTQPLESAQRECLIMLIQHGVDLAVTDADGRTPLIHAARAGDLESVRIITEAGVYVRTRDKYWKTALLNAAAAGHRDVVLYLASNGDIQSPSVRERRERGRR